MRRVLFIPWLCAALICAGASHATVIPYEASGTVSSVGGSITSVSAGNAYSITFMIDDSISDGNPNPLGGSYSGAVTSYSFTVGAYAAAGSTDLQIHDGLTANGDQILVDDSSPGGPLLDGLAPNVFNLVRLSDFTATALSSDAIPPPSTVGFPSNPSWTSTYFYLAFGASSFVSGTLTQVQVVPEPSSALLTAFGIAGLTIWRRRHATR